MLGDLSPKESNEQTGCKLHIHVGATGHADIKLSDGTVTVKKISPKEGGAVDFHVVFYTADVDAETLGDLGVLKSHDLDVEIAAPEVANVQVNLEDADGGKVTPIKGKGKGKGKGLGTDEDQAQRQADVLAKDPSQAKGDWPFPGADGPQTPEAAFAGTDR
jgi:hypothetical protein